MALKRELEMICRPLRCTWLSIEAAVGFEPADNCRRAGFRCSKLPTESTSDTGGGQVEYHQEY